MPLLYNVKSLEDLCKKKICQYQMLNKNVILEEGYKWRRFLIENLSANIRSDILCYEFLNHYSCTTYYLHKWVPMLTVLMDVGVQRIPPVHMHDLKDDLSLLTTVVSFLWIHRPKLKSLSMDLMYTYDDCADNYRRSCMKTAMDVLEKSLDEGLATRLVHLQLTYQCNNSMLRTIGKHAKCLKKLDVSCSSNITIEGVAGFLFKSDKTVKTMLREPKIHLYRYLRSTIRNPDILNTICFTLEEIRFEHTNTTSVGWILFLTCIQNLKYTEMPIEWDAMKIITTVWHQILKPKSLHLQLVKLFAWNINCNQIPVIVECLPHLKHLGTSLTHSSKMLDDISGSQNSKLWNNLHTLTLFLENYATLFLKIFCESGHMQNLSELTIRSSRFSNITFDLKILQRSCPNLIVLDVYTVSFYGDQTPTGKFKFLQNVTMSSPSAEIKSWFLFKGCPALKQFVLYNETDSMYWKNFFHDPSPLVRQQIVHLEIAFDHHDLVFDQLLSTANYITITEFIAKCAVLNVFGNILDFGIAPEDLGSLKDFIRKHNYSLTLLY